MKRLIEYMNFCPNCGESDPVKNTNSITCSHCGTQVYTNVACGVAAFIKNDDGKLLFMRRAKDPGKGMLDLIGGFVDAGESFEEALKREVQEEAGMNIDAIEYFGSFPNIYTYKEVTYDVADVFFTATSTNLPVQNDDETLGFEWIAPEDVVLDDIGLISIRNAVAKYIQENV